MQGYLDSLTSGLFHLLPARSSDLDHKRSSYSGLYEATKQRGTANLQLYLSNAFLPGMCVREDKSTRLPEVGHKSHSNHLSVVPDPRRKLRSMEQIPADKFEERILSWIKKHVPSNDLDVPDADRFTGDQLTIHNNELFSIREHVIGYVRDAGGVAEWVHTLPLRTLQRVLHLILPNVTSCHHFQPLPHDVDKKIFRTFGWCSDFDVETASIVVAVQPPFTLSPQDFKSMSRVVELKRVFLEGREGPQYHSTSRVWAKLWDVCRRSKCRYFVLTTYDEWLFGVFSPGWTHAHSALLRGDSQSPTIMEALVYWFASAMGAEDGWVAPAVAEAIESSNDQTDLVEPPLVAYSEPAPSESSWSARSDLLDSLSVASDETVLAHRLSPGPELDDVPILLDERLIGGLDSRLQVAQWQEGVSDEDSMGATPSTPRQASRYYSPAGDSDDSTCSIVEGQMAVDRRGGSWLTCNPDSYPSYEM